jgi:lipopolysaccharide export system protein LptA
MTKNSLRLLRPWMTKHSLRLLRPWRSRTSLRHLPPWRCPDWYNQLVTPWQKRARALVAVLAIGVIAVVAYTMRPRQAVTPPPAIEPIAAGTKIVTRGGDAIQLKGAQQDLRIEFDRQETSVKDETRLFDVKVIASNRNGRNYTITGREAQVGTGQSSFHITGDVRLETSDGLVAHAREATYTDVEKMVRAPGPVKFSRGRMNGTGDGFIYDEQRDILNILENADVHFAAEGAEGPMDVKAGAFIYARRDRFMRFERTMHMDRNGQLIDADTGHVRLYPDRDETDLIELRGNGRVTGGSQMGALKSMASKDMNLKYGEDGRTLQNATLATSASIELATKSGATAQRLDAESIDLALDPDGSVRSLAARDNATVSLPAGSDTGIRTIRSESLTGAGAAEGIREMAFEDGVEYREAATRARPARIARARKLNARIEPETGALVEARFSGDFAFSEGTMRATSDDAIYNITAGSLALTGKEATPHIEDEALTISANAIDVTLDPMTVAATGRVRSTMLPPQKPAGNAAAPRRPGLLGEKEPVQIVAEKLAYDESSRTADYSGQVRLIQDETTITADTLTLDESKGDLMANGKVMTQLKIAEPDAAAPARPTIARAGSFVYSDQTRLATYSTAAQMDGAQGNLRAAKIELRLARGGNTLEGLEADGQVTALVDQRTVTGAHLSYTPGDDKYIVTGAPVTMLDADCQETSGKTLTFWKASDRVQVDGNNEVRTQTKGGGKCPTAPPQ